MDFCVFFRVIEENFLFISIFALRHPAVFLHVILIDSIIHLLHNHGEFQKGFVLELFNLNIKPVRKRHNQCNADNADAGRKCRKQRAPLFCANILSRNLQRGKKAHAGFFQRIMIRLGRLLHRVGITHHLPVVKTDNPIGVFFRQFRIVRNHDDQLIFRNFAD